MFLTIFKLRYIKLLFITNLKEDMKLFRTKQELAHLYAVAELLEPSHNIVN